jgi:archaellum component FlaC
LGERNLIGTLTLKVVHRLKMKDKEIEKQLAKINNRLEKIEREYRSLIASLNSDELGGITTSTDVVTNLKVITDLKTHLARIERKLERFSDRIERLEKMML